MPEPGRPRRAENPHAIPVSELLARPEPARRHGTEPEAGNVFVGALLDSDDRGATGRAVRQAPRVLGAMTAVALVCGVLMAASYSLRTPDGDQLTDLAAAPQHITGSKVFQPDLIKESLEERLGGTSVVADEDELPADEDERDANAADERDGADEPSDRGDQGDHPEQPGQPEDPGIREAPSSAEQPAPTTRVPAPTMTASVPPTTTSSSGGLVCDTVPILCPVLGFYEAAPSEPEQAYELLGDSMRDEGGVESFSRSWQGVRSVTVDAAEPVGADQVQVRVTLIQRDGSTLVTAQRITVDLGERPKLVDAELLGVQYLPAAR